MPLCQRKSGLMAGFRQLWFAGESLFVCFIYWTTGENVTVLYLFFPCFSSFSETMIMRRMKRRRRRRISSGQPVGLKAHLLWLKARFTSTSPLPWLAGALSEVEPLQEVVPVLAATTATWTSPRLLGSVLWSACWAAPSGSVRVPPRPRLLLLESPPSQRSQEVKEEMEVQQGGHLRWKQPQTLSPPLTPPTPTLQWISLQSWSGAWRLTVRVCHLYLLPDVTAKAA